MAMRKIFSFAAALALCIAAGAQAPDSVAVDAQDTVAKKESAKVKVTPKFMRNGDVRDFQLWVTERLTYPKEARDLGISGRVKMRVAIGIDGKITDIEVIESPSNILTKEVMRVMRMSPKWKPGTIDGVPKKVSFVMPVHFKNIYGTGQTQSRFFP